MSAFHDRNEEDKEEMRRYRVKYIIIPVICRKFGCGKKLSLEEQRMGDYCRQHWDNEDVLTIESIKIK